MGKEYVLIISSVTRVRTEGMIMFLYDYWHDVYIYIHIVLVYVHCVYMYLQAVGRPPKGKQVVRCQCRALVILDSELTVGKCPRENWCVYSTCTYVPVYLCTSSAYI